MKNIADFSQKLKRDQKGFTLIELLVVIGILAVLLAIVLVAINPAQQFQQANDTQRQSDVNSILNAVNQYMVDNAGALPAGMDSTTEDDVIGGDTTGGQIDLCADLVPDYIADMPGDPSADGYVGCSDASYNTEYTISVSAENDRVTVSAPNAEGDDTISVTR